MAAGPGDCRARITTNRAGALPGKQKRRKADMEDKAEIRRLSEARAAEMESDCDDSEKQAGDNTKSAFVMRCCNRGETGDAELFNHLHGDRFCFDHADNKWYEFKEHHYSECRKNEPFAALEKVVDAYGEAAQRENWLLFKANKKGDMNAEAKHSANRDALLKKVSKLQSLQKKKNALELAAVGRGASGDEWDRDPWVIGCQNGVLDLKTGQLRDGKPEDFIKTVCPAEWEGLDAKAPSWEKFIRDTFDHDSDLVRYVQKLMGYALIGKPILHIIVVLWGIGRNGKGTLLETLKHVLGELAYKSEAELLLEQKYARGAGAPNSSVIALRGRRIVFVSETGEGSKFNAAKVKELVGGDTLNARAPYGRRQVEFTPSHTLFLITNDKPYAPPGDYAFWSRMHLVPFNLSFVERPTKPHERIADLELPERLKAEAPGILAWLVRGCLNWQKEGLNPPETVKAATESYREENDIIGEFLNEMCVKGEGFEVKAGELYSEYVKWCEDSGHRYKNKTTFGKDITKRFDKYKAGDGRFRYIGIGLLG